MELIEITDESGNPNLFLELQNELKTTEKKVSLLYLETLMSGKADNKNALLEIHSGAGGVESQDWVEMLAGLKSCYYKNRR